MSCVQDGGMRVEDAPVGVLSPKVLSNAERALNMQVSSLIYFFGFGIFENLPIWDPDRYLRPQDLGLLMSKLLQLASLRLG